MPALSRAEFERVIAEALDGLPERFARMLDNVVIVAEDEPSDEDLDTVEDGDDELLGIYRGVALIDRTHDDPIVPDEIAIFRGPIGRVSRTRAEAVDEVRRTVVHELGHFFGLDHDDMPF